MAMKTTIQARMKRCEDESLINRVRHCLLENGKVADPKFVAAKILFDRDSLSPVGDEEILAAVVAIA